MNKFEMPQKDSNSPDLRLHRKFILVLCFILIFLKYGGVSISSVSLLGTIINIANRNALFLGLWIILLYSILRYWQYFNQDSWDSFKRSFRRLQDRYYQRKFLHLLQSVIEPEKLVDQSYSEYHNLPEFSRGAKSGFWKRKYVLNVSTKNPADFKNSIGPALHAHVDVEYSLFKHFPKQTLKVAWHFVMNTPIFFEFIFPFLLIAFTIIYCGFGNWEGSFANLFMQAPAVNEPLKIVSDTIYYAPKDTIILHNDTIRQVAVDTTGIVKVIK